MCQKALDGSRPDHQLPSELSTIIILTSQASVSPQSEPEVGSPHRRAEEEPGTIIPATLTSSPAFFEASPTHPPPPPGSLPHLLSIPKTLSSWHLHSRSFVPCGYTPHAGIYRPFLWRGSSWSQGGPNLSIRVLAARNHVCGPSTMPLTVLGPQG